MQLDHFTYSRKQYGCALISAKQNYVECMCEPKHIFTLKLCIRYNHEEVQRETPVLSSLTPGLSFIPLSSLTALSLSRPKLLSIPLCPKSGLSPRSPSYISHSIAYLSLAPSPWLSESIRSVVRSMAEAKPASLLSALYHNTSLQLTAGLHNALYAYTRVQVCIHTLVIDYVHALIRSLTRTHTLIQTHGYQV